MNHPDAAKVGKFLGVHPRTVHRWIRAGHAPKPVLWALYWLTPYARSTIYHHEEYGAQLNAGLIRSLQERQQALEREMARVLSLADFGCANDVTLMVDAPRRSA